MPDSEVLEYSLTVHLPPDWGRHNAINLMEELHNRGLGVTLKYDVLTTARETRIDHCLLGPWKVGHAQG